MLLPSISQASIQHRRSKKGYGPITTPAGTMCGLCHRQVSPYTCPRCNIPYCSLTCFRSEEHAQCSEPFYKREIENEIQTQPAASANERARMVDMLRRLEDGEQGGDGLDASDDGSEDDELLKNLAGVDIESISPDQLWRLLPPFKRDIFLKAMQDPESAQARTLLSGQDGFVKSPWWIEDVEDDDTDGAKERPAMMQLPTNMLFASTVSTQAQPGLSLLYNTLAVIIAYSYTVRHFGALTLTSLAPASALNALDSTSINAANLPETSPAFADTQAAAQTLHRLAPFLGDKNSNLILGDDDSVVKYLWGRVEFEEDGDDVKIGHTAQTIILLLRDAATLFTPTRVAVVSPDETPSDSALTLLRTHPHKNVLLALSDASHLFEALPPLERGKTPEKLSSQTRPSDARSARASYKLRFYASWFARSVDDRIIQRLLLGVHARMRMLELENADYGESGDVKIRD